MKKVKDVRLDQDYWNLVKGIGIICVVLGHVCIWAQNFIYTFHLQLFYFVTGYLYNENKYGDRPWLHTKRKFQTTWSVYVVLYIVVTLLHNVLLDLGLQPLAFTRYSWKDMLIQILLDCTGNGSELLLGPAYFLPVIVLASVIFGFIVFISRYIEKYTGKTYLKLIFQGVVVVVCAVGAYPLVAHRIWTPAYVSFSLEVLPYLWFGYLLRNYIGDIRKYLNPIIGLFCALITYKISLYHLVDFTLGIIYPYMHIAALFGIYMCLCLAEMFYHIRYVHEGVTFMGRNSMFIMLVHFPIVRLLDKAITLYIGDPTGELYNKIPVVFEDLWPIYSVVVLTLSFLLAILWEKRKKFSHYFVKGKNL